MGGKMKMGTFMQTYERVAVKYAEYIEAKLKASVTLKTPPKAVHPGQELEFAPAEEEYRQFVLEMKTLNELAQTLKGQKQEEDVYEPDPEELENLKATEAELEEFNKKTVCFVERNEETGAVEITPGSGGKIILNDTGQIKAFLQIVGSYLKGGTEDGGRG